jgi:hypothetical protein
MLSIKLCRQLCQLFIVLLQEQSISVLQHVDIILNLLGNLQMLALVCIFNSATECETCQSLNRCQNPTRAHSNERTYGDMSGQIKVRYVHSVERCTCFTLAVLYAMITCGSYRYRKNCLDSTHFDVMLSIGSGDRAGQCSGKVLVALLSRG